MRKTALLLAALAALPLAHPAAAAPPPAAPQAEIPFADHGGVNDWQAEGDRTVYFEDLHRHWFKATLMSPAFDLPFAEAIGIEPGPSGSLDSFGAVIVRGQRYQFASFVAVDQPPLAKRPRHKLPPARK